jgi:hypothetical protein
MSIKMVQKCAILQESSVALEPQTVVSQASVESVMRAIRQRLKARLALCRQVQALGKMSCNYNYNLFSTSSYFDSSIIFFVNLALNVRYNYSLFQRL